LFKRIIEAGQVLEYGEEISWGSQTLCKEPEKKHSPVSATLWRSPLKCPTHCYLEEDQCEEVGKIQVTAPSGGWPDVVNWVQTLIVGETEFTMKWLIKETGEEHECTIDFL